MLHKEGGGNKRVIDNYRGISITSNVGKLYTKLLGRRLEEDVEKKGMLGEIQFGFRKGRRTTDAIYILSQIIENRKRNGKKTALAFLDVKKAYDRVDRDTLWRVLSELGYEGKFLHVLQQLYKNTTAIAALGEVTSDKIPLNVGLKQGCVLSPMLFALYIKEVGDMLLRSEGGVG